MEIEGKLFVVTGAGNGMGRAIALQLLERGARVAAVSRGAESLAGTAALARPGAPLTTHVADVSDRAAIEALPAAVEAAHGRSVDGVINVAGIIHRFAKVADLGIEELERVVDVDFWGTVHVAKAFLPHLLRRPEAALVLFGSMGALIPFPGQGAYCASKGGVHLLTETLRAELDGSSVTVSLVMPGAVETNILGGSGVAGPRGLTMADAAKFGIRPTRAKVAARRVIRGIERGRFRILIGPDARIFDWLARLIPRRAITLIATFVAPILGVR